MKRLTKQRMPFERLIVPKSVALDMFKFNKYKQEIIDKKVPDGTSCTAYKCGTLIDLCKGPHLPNTGYVKALEITKHSSAYWLGNSELDSLQRVYAISFPDTKQLKEFITLRDEAKKRDHRVIGQTQELFFFNQLSPGSAFFLPHGARIYNTLVNFIKAEYWKRGFTEVVSPNVYNTDLWRTSGHYQNYQENMFLFNIEGQEFAMKPMNCPGHCLMFQHRLRSYRELPIRFADFGALHRNELSGALSGLTRVRRFQQDDAHIFCAPEQISSEIKGALSFLKHVYGIFGFTFDLKLSTRPEKYLGDIEMWEKAEKQLSESLNEFGQKWEVNPGDGAFYGPKIDITLMDALKRRHQCATVQLDFNLPLRFNLEFESENGIKRPVMIHRAILGSVERFIAILCEQTAGKWPFWLSPRQCCIVPISEKFNDYAEKVRMAIHDAGFYVDSDLTDKKMQKKIREAQLAQYNFILVVVQEEIDTATVNVRTRDNQVQGAKTIQELIAEFNILKKDLK